MSTNNSTRRFALTGFAALAIAGFGVLGAVTAQAAGPEGGTCRNLTVNAGAGNDKLVRVATGDINGDSFKECTGPFGLKTSAASQRGALVQSSDM